LRDESGILADVVRSCNKILHVNNQPAIEDPTLSGRAHTRLALLLHLSSCRDVYRPRELDQINERIATHINDKNKVQKQLEEMQKFMQQREAEIQALGQRLAQQQAEAANTLQRMMAEKERESKRVLEQIAAQQAADAERSRQQHTQMQQELQRAREDQTKLQLQLQQAQHSAAQSVATHTKEKNPNFWDRIWRPIWQPVARVTKKCIIM